MIKISNFLILILLIHKCQSDCNGNENTCNSKKRFSYLFYDVNPPEGFNLRRDVYLRMAILATELQKVGNWVLVLPPWPHLYHWRSTTTAQNRLPWSHFFDIRSMQKFAPVIEMMDFLDMHPDGKLDQVYILQHFEEMFQTGKFVDKLELGSCNQDLAYHKNHNNRYRGDFWGLKEVTAAYVDCLSFHGHASMLVPFLKNSSHNAVMIDHAEVALHDRFGDATYWKARRSMRFVKNLRNIARDFRKSYLNSTDDADATIVPSEWTLEKPNRKAIGGPYLSVHLRRRDFIQGRGKEVPSISDAAQQICQALEELDLKTVFVATDAPKNEQNELNELLAKQDFRMVTFEPSAEQLNTIKDGGVAIIQQIICSYARKFYGTHESTFSFRIQEEREIMGFTPESTFNRLCGSGKRKCKQPSKWLIVF